MQVSRKQQREAIKEFEAERGSWSTRRLIKQPSSLKATEEAAPQRAFKNTQYTHTHINAGSQHGRKFLPPSPFKGSCVEEHKRSDEEGERRRVRRKSKVPKGRCKVAES